MKILFFGTPNIAVPFLKELLNTEEIVGVVTQPDKPAKRGQNILPPAVKKEALANNLKIFQPTKFDETTISELKELKPEAGVVVSYGKLIPQQVFEIPFFGCFNIHFSLLPKYRGAAPIQWSLINGETVTGVSTFWIEKTLDTGPILVQKQINIEPDDDSQKLTEKLIPVGIQAMNETIEKLKKGDCKGDKQEGAPSFAPCLTKETGKIDWNQDNNKIINLIRGTKPWPGCHTIIKSGKNSGKKLKIIKASKLKDLNLVNNEYKGSGKAGQVVGIAKGAGFIVKCNEGYLIITEVHFENKKQAAAWSFWQGRYLELGDIFI